MQKLSKTVSRLAAFVVGSAVACGAMAEPKVVGDEVKTANVSAKFDLVELPGGKVTIKDKDGKEKSVDVKPFKIGKTEMTWDVYDIYWQRLDLTATEIKDGVDAENRPSKPYSPPDRGWGREGSPAGSITYAEAQKFVRWLSKATKHKYRLPTEAEWEYACRAGSEKPVKLDAKDLEEVAWFANNTEQKTQPVAKKKPNAWGLHDMLGNVAEWVIKDDGTGAIAGGSYDDEAGDVNSEARKSYEPGWQRDDPQDPKGKSWLSNGGHIGIRVVRED